MKPPGKPTKVTAVVVRALTRVFAPVVSSVSDVVRVSAGGVSGALIVAVPAVASGVGVHAAREYDVAAHLRG